MSVNGSSLSQGIAWGANLLPGSLGIGIATLAVAWFGLGMMFGHFSGREALKIALGCFILFGAPLIAKGLLGAIQGEAVSPRRTESATGNAIAPRAEPSFDPYAGAALPQQ